MINSIGIMNEFKPIVNTFKSGANPTKLFFNFVVFSVTLGHLMLDYFLSYVTNSQA